MTKDRPLPKITKLPYMGKAPRFATRRTGHDSSAACDHEDAFGLYGADASYMRFKRNFNL